MSENKNKTAINFTEKEAIEYATYLENKEKIDTIIQSGIICIKSGQGIIHFDKDSVIQLIEEHHALYRRKRA